MNKVYLSIYLHLDLFHQFYSFPPIDLVLFCFFRFILKHLVFFILMKIMLRF